MKRRARGIVGLVVLSLGLGVVTTYGVAWGLMNRSFSNFGAVPAHRFIRDDTGWNYSVYSRSSVAYQISRPVWKGPSVPWPDETTGPPHWSVIAHLSPSQVATRCLQIPEEDLYYVEERSAGWPALAVAARLANAKNQLMPLGEYDWTICLGPGSLQTKVKLAFMPIAEGFAVDVLVFGLGWSIVVVGPRWIRGRIRVRLSRAGRCAKCRYDLSGLSGGVCPECGSAVKGM